MQSEQSTVSVNGEQEPLRDARLEQLLQRLGRAGEQGIAVALNDAVVPRSQWGKTPLAPGDRIEIVVAVQGG